MKFLRQVKERFNLLIYEEKEATLRTLRYVSLFISLAAVGSMIIYYGFPLDKESKDLITHLFQASFVFYIFRYIIQLLYSFSPRKFLMDNKLEAILLGFILIDGLSVIAFNVQIIDKLFEYAGIRNFKHYYNLVLQLYLLLLVILSLGTDNYRLKKIKVDPSFLVIISFLILILGGAGLLCLPEMTVIKGSMNFLDALFTSASATCVTGLAVEDTATFFSFKGQLVLLLLIKLGGLNIVAFSMFMGLVSSFGVGVKHHEVIEDFTNKNTILSSKGLLGKILGLSLLIELIGAICIYFTLPDLPRFENVESRIFASLFHSVSAFNNAGMSVFENGLYNEMVRTEFTLHMIIGGLIFLGALGFTTIFDILSISNMRERLKKPWKQLKISSKIALYSSSHLLLFGTILFYFLEKDGVAFSHFKNPVENGIGALFQSITTRTAGFSTVDIGQLTTPVLILFLFLMFIGGSSSSTAGGIKTSTFTLLVLSAVATIRGKKNAEMYKKTISRDLLEKAYSILIFSLACILISTFILSITEQHLFEQHGITVMDIMFEEISAFSTVGLSTGITPHLSSAGKIVIILSMFIGRLGTLTLAFALSRRAMTNRYKYPNAHMMVG